MLGPREYCCCAIPLVNAGVYATLIEQFILALLVGILSFATPSIVGAAVFSAAPIILAIICFVAAGIQVLGFIGVAKERPILFKRYVTLHGLITAAAFGVAIAWTVISITRRSTAVSECRKDFFPAENNSQVSGAGETLCNIFPWVSIGLMGGLIVILGIAQLYFFLVLSSYGRQQRDDHFKYNSVYNPFGTQATGNNNNIAMEKTEYGRDNESYPRHARQESAASMSDVLSEPSQQPKDSMQYSYGQYGAGPSYPPTRQSSYGASSSHHATRQNSNGASLAHPHYAYTEEPEPTPTYYSGYSRQGGYAHDAGISQPSRTQSHPAEGSFGRKAPRLVKQNPSPSY